jgi:hypothetical protein
MKQLYFLFLLLLIQVKTFSACELYDLTIDKTDCTKEKKFSLIINFKYKDVGECFTIKGNGKTYGTFKYNQLPVTIGPFNGDCKTNYEFIIRDCKTEGCKLTSNCGVVCCENPPCELSDMTVEKTECDDNGKFCAVINFSHSGNSSCFKLSGNGKEYGKFGYSQLPVKICGLEGDCATEYEFKATDCENFECFATQQLGIVCCDLPCKLSELKIEKTDCNDAGQFFVFINFKYSNTSTCFKIKGNGKDYGKFKYTDLPIKLGPFEGDCKTVYEFTIFDCENEKCSISKEIGKVCCDKKNCEIKELKITKTDCDKSKNFYVLINFKYSNTSTCFKVRGNGVDYGTFNYTQLPIKIGPLKGDCKKQYEFVITDCEKETCKASKNIGIVCCEEKKKGGDTFENEGGIHSLNNIEQWKPDYEVESTIDAMQQTQDKLIVRFNQNLTEKAETYLYSLYGARIKNILDTRSENIVELNISELNPGFYILVVKDNDRQQVIRFFKK